MGSEMCIRDRSTTVITTTTVCIGSLCLPPSLLLQLSALGRCVYHRHYYNCLHWVLVSTTVITTTTVCTGSLCPPPSLLLRLSALGRCVHHRHYYYDCLHWVVVSTTVITTTTVCTGSLCLPPSLLLQPELFVKDTGKALGKLSRQRQSLDRANLLQCSESNAVVRQYRIVIFL